MKYISIWGNSIINKVNWAWRKRDLNMPQNNEGTTTEIIEISASSILNSRLSK